MGNSSTRHESSAGSFRENSRQYHEYRALENKIRLLKIQANNYHGVGQDVLYTDMFASVQDTIGNVRYLREKSKNSNRRIEYDMLDVELRNCLQILSSKIHQGNDSNKASRPQSQVPQNKIPEQSGAGELWQYALDSLETRIMQLKSNLAQFSANNGNQNILSQFESTCKGLHKDLDNLVVPNNSKKLYLSEILQDILNDIASKQTELYRKSKYDNLEGSSDPTDPNLQILLKMARYLSVFKDREYLTAENSDVPKMIDTLNCYKSDLHNLRITSKDVNKKHNELLGFIENTIKLLKENDNSTSTTKQTRDAVDHAAPQQQKEDPLMQNVMEELNKIQKSAKENSTNENHLKRMLDLLQQVNASLQHKNSQSHHQSIDNMSSTHEHGDPFNPNHQYQGSTDDVRKVVAKTALQTALERKGYRKTFLANTMIKQHAAKMKRISASSDMPDPDHSMIDDEHQQQGNSDSGHSNSVQYKDKFVKPNPPINSDLGGEGNQYNSLPTSERRGSPQQATPNSSRKHNDNRSNNKAHLEMDSIRRELEHLRHRVDKFNDQRNSSLYEELETLLLELLVRLENVQSDAGALEATDVLVYTIRDTQTVLYILDEKALKFKPHKYAY